MVAKVEPSSFGEESLVEPQEATLRSSPRIDVARLLSAAVVVLFLLFGGFLWWEHAVALRQAANFAEQITRLLSDNFGRGLGAADAVLDQAIEQIARTGAQEASETTLRAQLLAITARVPFIGAIRLADREGRALAEVTYEPGPSPLGAALQESPASSFHLTDGTMIGRISGGEKPAVVMSRSFTGAGGDLLEVAISIDVGHFTRLLPGQDRGAPYRLLVFGEEGRSLIEYADGAARTVPQDPVYLLARLSGREQAVLRDGDGAITVVRKLQDQPLYAAVGLPIHVVQLRWASSGWPIWAVAFAAVLLLAVVLLLAARQAREQERLSLALGRLNESLEQRVKLRTRELELLVREREAVSRDLARSLQQKELLFREVHHRVKNNLQVINSLLSLQSGRASSELRPFLEESRRRLLAMRRLHEQLYQMGDGTSLDLGAYLATMVEETVRSFGAQRRIRLTVEAATIRISLDQATPVALMATEVISNAMKHAFPAGREGTIAVTLREQQGRVVLEIRDDGIGLPQEARTREGQGLGRTLIRLLAKQLRGEVDYGSDRGGTHFRLSFPRIAVPSERELEPAP